MPIHSLSRALASNHAFFPHAHAEEENIAIAFQEVAIGNDLAAL